MKHTRDVFHSVMDDRLRWIKNDFLEYLNEWRSNALSRPLVGEVNRDLMLLSIPTEEGLRAASLSMAAIIEECQAMGAEYVLPRRINQDPLESFFGYQRQKVSRGDTPSVGLFCATARSSEAFKLDCIVGSNVQLPS